MIRFTTKDSKYEVTVQQNKFHVKKYEWLGPDTTNTAVGQTRVSTKMRLEVGDRASFDSWSTSEVLKIEDV